MKNISDKIVNFINENKWNFLVIKELCFTNLCEILG